MQTSSTIMIIIMIIIFLGIMITFGGDDGDPLPPGPCAVQAPPHTAPWLVPAPTPRARQPP